MVCNESTRKLANNNKVDNHLADIKIDGFGYCYCFLRFHYRTLIIEEKKLFKSQNSNGKYSEN